MITAPVSTKGSKASSSPRFSLRFEGGKGLLTLSAPCRTKTATIEELELEVAHLDFPLDVAAGVAAFQHHRTIVRRARVVFDFGRLMTALSQSGLRLTLAGAGPSSVEAELVDAAGAVGATLVFEVSNSDLLVHPVRVRSGTDGPGTPHQRLFASAASFGAVAEEARGRLRLRRPLRQVFLQALVARGHRLPDERASGLSRAFVDEAGLAIELGTDASDGAPDSARTRPPEAVGAVTTYLATGNPAGALEWLDARASVSAAEGAEASDAYPQLRAAVLLELPGHEEAAKMEASRIADPLVRASIKARVALRVGSFGEVLQAAREYADAEPLAGVASDMLARAAHRVAKHEPRMAHELLGRSLSLRPWDRALLIRYVRSAREAKDEKTLLGVAQRLGPRDRASSIELVAELAGALLALGALEPASRLLDEARGGAPLNPVLAELRAECFARTGEVDRAIALLDSVVSGVEARADVEEAARLHTRVAELLDTVDRSGEAEARIERAIAARPSAARIALLARQRVRAGRMADARKALAQLLTIRETGPSYSEALADALRLHLTDPVDVESARAFLALLRSANIAADNFAELRERVSEAEAIEWLSRDAEVLLSCDRDLLGRIVRSARDVDAAFGKLLRAFEQGAGERGADNVLMAALEITERLGNPDAVTAAKQRVADAAARAGGVDDAALLQTLEPLSSTGALRAELAEQLSNAQRSAGEPGLAARSFARAAELHRDFEMIVSAVDDLNANGDREEALRVIARCREIFDGEPEQKALMELESKLRSDGEHA